MGLPLFVARVESDLPAKPQDKRTVLSPAPAGVRAARRPETGAAPRHSASSRLSPSEWMQRYGPDNSTAARLRRQPDVPQPIAPEIPLLNVMEAYIRLDPALQPTYERRLRRILGSVFDPLKEATISFRVESSILDRRARRRGEQQLISTQRESARAQVLARISNTRGVARLTPADVTVIRDVTREIENSEGNNGAGLLARNRLRIMRRRWNASPYGTPAVRLRPDDAATRRVMDGLGDRERSPEELWNTLRYTMTPDPDLPSTNSSFTSIPNTTQRSGGQDEDMPDSHWLGLSGDMDAQEADALLPPTASGDPDCEPPPETALGGARNAASSPEDDDQDGAVSRSRTRPPGPARLDPGALAGMNNRLEDRRRLDPTLPLMHDATSPGLETARPTFVFGGSEESRASVRRQLGLGSVPTQGEWEGQLSVGADDDDDDQPTPRAEGQGAAAAPAMERSEQRQQERGGTTDGERLLDIASTVARLDEWMRSGRIDEDLGTHLQELLRGLASTNVFTGALWNEATNRPRQSRGDGDAGRDSESDRDGRARGTQTGRDENNEDRAGHRELLLSLFDRFDRA